MGFGGREPATVISAVSALLSSILKAAQLLGIIELDGDQMAGLSLVIDNALLVASVLFIRSVVTPTSNPVVPTGTDVLSTAKVNGKTEVVGVTTV